MRARGRIATAVHVCQRPSAVDEIEFCAPILVPHAELLAAAHRSLPFWVANIARAFVLAIAEVPISFSDYAPKVASRITVQGTPQSVFTLPSQK